LIRIINKTIDFHAELMCAGTEPFAPGSVKSTVWIYIRYKQGARW